jgi:hypothetical protein
MKTEVVKEEACSTSAAALSQKVLAYLVGGTVKVPKQLANLGRISMKSVKV